MEVAASERSSFAERYKLVVLGGVFVLFAATLFGVYSTMPQLSVEERAHFKLPSCLDEAKDLGRLLSHYKQEHFGTVLAGVIVTYVMLQSFAIPGSIFLTILSGYLFPFFLALVLVCSCSACGAFICYLLSHLIGRRFVQNKLADRLAKWRADIQEQSDNLFSYIVFLRVTPLLPNWFINIASPVLDVPAWPFFWGTFFGVAPPSFLFIQAGTTLEQMTHTNVAWSWSSVALIVFFAALSLLPVLYNRSVKKPKSKSA